MKNERKKNGLKSKKKGSKQVNILYHVRRSQMDLNSLKFCFINPECCHRNFFLLLHFAVGRDANCGLAVEFSIVLRTLRWPSQPILLVLR